LRPQQAAMWSALLLAVVGVGPVWAAATLKGMVVLNRAGGGPVMGVAVSAEGANQDTTRDDGRFVLVFPNHQAGQDTRVIVARPGWEVVNAIQLEHRLPVQPDVRPLEIIICKAAELEQRARDFTGLEVARRSSNSTNAGWQSWKGARPRRRRSAIGYCVSGIRRCARRRIWRGNSLPDHKGGPAAATGRRCGYFWTVSSTRRCNG